jgi:hypothetical protein
MTSTSITTLDVIKKFTPSLDTVNNTAVAVFLDFINTCARNKRCVSSSIHIASGISRDNMTMYVLLNTAFHYIARRGGFTISIKTIHSVYVLWAHKYKYKIASMPESIAPLSNVQMFVFFKNSFGFGTCQCIYSFLYEASYKPQELLCDKLNIVYVFGELDPFERFVAFFVFHAKNPIIGVDDFVALMIAKFGVPPNKRAAKLLTSILTKENNVNTTALVRALPILDNSLFVDQLNYLRRCFCGWGLVLNKTIHSAK